MKHDNAGEMSDEQRCRLIAEFEFGPDANTALMYPDCMYESNVNATMRAARKLPDDLELYVGSGGLAWITDEETKQIQTNPPSPARAAFIALSDYLAAKRKSPDKP